MEAQKKYLESQRVEIARKIAGGVYPSLTRAFKHARAQVKTRSSVKGFFAEFKAYLAKWLEPETILKTAKDFADGGS